MFDPEFQLFSTIYALLFWLFYTIKILIFHKEKGESERMIVFSLFVWYVNRMSCTVR